MASSYYPFLFTFVSLTFLLSNNNLNPMAAKSPDLLNNLCSSSLNASGCLEFLKPLYREGDSLQTLAQNAVDSGSKFLLLIYDDIHIRELKTVNDPYLNGAYRKCGEEYTAATNAFDQAKKILQSKVYQVLLNLASNALLWTQFCDLDFVPGKSEPSDFKSLNLKAQNVCSIIVAISKSLLSGKTLS